MHYPVGSLSGWSCLDFCSFCFFKCIFFCEGWSFLVHVSDLGWFLQSWLIFVFGERAPFGPPGKMDLAYQLHREVSPFVQMWKETILEFWDVKLKQMWTHPWWWYTKVVTPFHPLGMGSDLHDVAEQVDVTFSARKLFGKWLATRNHSNIFKRHPQKDTTTISPPPTPAAATATATTTTDKTAESALFW